MVLQVVLLMLQVVSSCLPGVGRHILQIKLIQICSCLKPVHAVGRQEQKQNLADYSFSFCGMCTCHTEMNDQREVGRRLKRLATSHAATWAQVGGFTVTVLVAAWAILHFNQRSVSFDAF